MPSEARERLSEVLGRLARRSNIWDVAHRDPLTAVVAALTAPPGFALEPEPISPGDGRVPRAMVMSHGPFARDPGTIAVIKERESGDRRLYAVSFDDFGGNGWSWLLAAERCEIGWVAHGVAGGSNGPARRDGGMPRPSAAGSGPWLNLCGQWGRDTFYAGGRLDPAGAGIGRAQLTLHDGGQLEDGRAQLTLHDGGQLEDDGISDVSLVIGRHGEPPRTVDIYAPDGALLSSQDAY